MLLLIHRCRFRMQDTVYITFIASTSVPEKSRVLVPVEFWYAAAVPSW